MQDKNKNLERFEIKSVHENQQGEVWLTNTFGALSVGGGKPGQGYPCILIVDKSEEKK